MPQIPTEISSSSQILNFYRNIEESLVNYVDTVWEKGR